MNAVLVVLATLLGVAFLAVGTFHVVAPPAVVAIAEHTGHSRAAYQRIGALEVLGAAGVLLGLWIAPLGVAAAVGLAALMIGAVITHVRVGDGPAGWSASALFAVLAGAVAVVRGLTI